jgi:hypothetical protein
MVTPEDNAEDNVKDQDNNTFPLELQIFELKRALKAYDDFSKANGDWVDDSDEEEGGVPKFVLDARKLLD